MKPQPTLILPCGGIKRGQAPLFAHDFAEQSVVCYTLCRRCRENAVAAGAGNDILKRQESGRDL